MKKVWLFVVVCGYFVVVSAAAFPFASTVRYFFNFAVSGYYLAEPQIHLGSHASAAPDYNNAGSLATFNYHDLNIAYHAAVGYLFHDYLHPVLSKLFGTRHAVVFAVNYLNSSHSSVNKDLGLGKIWQINGQPLFPGATASQINQTDLSGRFSRYGLALYFKGYKELTPKILFNPFFGLVADHLKIKTDYVVNYATSDPPVGANDEDYEHYRTWADYFGIAMGGRLNFAVNRRWQLFSELNFQLLHALAYLRATQNPAVHMPAPPGVAPQYITDSQEQQLTYRAIASVGLNYQLFAADPNIYLTLQAGVDLWGYRPQVAMVDSASSGAVHLKKATSVDGFVSLAVTVPIA